LLLAVLVLLLSIFLIAVSGAALALLPTPAIITVLGLVICTVGAALVYERLGASAETVLIAGLPALSLAVGLRALNDKLVKKLNLVFHLTKNKKNSIKYSIG
jgi:hypothetical protein